MQRGHHTRSPISFYLAIQPGVVTPSASSQIWQSEILLQAQDGAGGWELLGCGLNSDRPGWEGKLLSSGGLCVMNWGHGAVSLLGEQVSKHHLYNSFDALSLHR